MLPIPCAVTRDLQDAESGKDTGLEARDLQGT